MVEKLSDIDRVEVDLVSWFANKVVNILCTYVECDAVSTKKRFSKKDKKYIEIKSPKAKELRKDWEL